MRAQASSPDRAGVLFQGAPVLALLCLLAGCWTAFHGQRPVSPQLREPVSSLQPTLQWEPATEAGVTYDVRLQEYVTNEAFRDPNELPFYREGLAEARCWVDTPLKPGHQYLWAVRVRRGTEVTGWSTYDHGYFAVLFWGKSTGLHYSFLVPASLAPPKPAPAPAAPPPGTAQPTPSM